MSKKSITKENKITLQQITRQEKDYLIANNLLRLVGGKYENLTSTSKKKKKHRKKFYVPDYLADLAKKMYEK